MEDIATASGKAGNHLGIDARGCASDRDLSGRG
jgi:hypothetical protein